MTGATNRQIVAIHAACSARGIRGDAYRRLLKDRFDVGSSTDLTVDQASDLLDSMGIPRPAPKPRRRRRRLPHGVDRLITQPQRALIAKLLEQLGVSDDDAFELWCQRTCGASRPRTTREANLVVEGLKAMRRKRAPRG